MPEINLKPCPFCGAKIPLSEKIYNSNYTTEAVDMVSLDGWEHESNCLFYGQDMECPYKDKSWLIERWNRRAYDT